MKIEIGQVFNEKDKRFSERHVRVIEVKGIRARCETCNSDGSPVAGARRTWISFRTLRTRFNLVSDDTKTEKGIAELDKYFPPGGFCVLCGGPDARHRVWDAIMDRAGAGESVKELAEDYDVPIEAVEMVLRIRPYAD